MTTIPGDISTNATITGTGTYTSSLEFNADSDWWRFAAVAGRTYQFNISGDGSANSLDDVAFAIRNSSGDTIISRSSHGSLSFTASSAGPFYISVADGYVSDNNAEGNYVIRAYMNDYIPSNNSTTQTVVNGVRAGSLEANGDADWYRVNLTVGQAVDFRLSGDGSQNSLDDGRILLLDQFGNSIVSSTTHISATASYTGVYYVVVRDDYSSDGAAEGNYQINARLTDNIVANSSTTAVLRDGSVFRSAIDARNDSDWIRFDAVAGRTYTFTLNGDGSGQALSGRYLNLRDAQGNQIDYDYTSSTGAVTFTWTASSTGRFFLDVDGYDSGDWGNYVLSVISNSPQVLGTAGHDILNGGANNNRIVGYAGNDRLSGGAGNDTLLGGAGNDTLDGGAGIDTADYSGTAAARVYLNVAGPQNTWQGFDVLMNIENILGGSGADRFFGSAAANVLDGGAGNDQLYGGGGNDTLIGGAGDDFFAGGAGFDTIVFTGNAAVLADLVTTRATGQGNDTLGGVENLTGGNGNDSLYGNAAANVLNGGAGADIIMGRGGSDVLTGGAGADRFIFANFEGNDRITDFQDGIDRIQIGGPTNSFADLTIVNGGGSAVISWSGGTTITLTNIASSQLTAADFIFV